MSWRDFVELTDTALLAQCTTDRFRASGPGGQHRNVTDSAVRLRHHPTGIDAVAVESRSQHENRARALRRLRLAIALAIREPLDLEAYTPSVALAALTDRGRIRISASNPRYPVAVGEVFDVLEAASWRLRDAAAALDVATGAVGRFLESDAATWRAAVARRAAFGLPPLRAQR